MKTTHAITFLCLLLAWGALHAQSIRPEGRYRVVETSGDSRWDFEADTLRCLSVDEEPGSPRWTGHTLRILDEELEHEYNSFSYDSIAVEMLSTWSSFSTPIEIIHMSQGKPWYLLKGNPAGSRYFWQVEDTLWLCHLLGGELPISFIGGKAQLSDTLGLQILLATIGSLALRDKHTSIEITIHHPEVSANRKRGVRLAKRRLAVLQKRLQSGLGDAYPLVRYVEKKSAASNQGYSANYRLY